MTVKLENACHNTDLLVAKQPRRHFRTAVRPVHWQLRSLMGVANQDTIYYPSGGNNLHIQRLNTTTRESETVRLLPFSPRCLVYKNGWICCGGEFGEFAAISVDGANEKMDLEADARLPIDLDPARPDDNIFSLLSRSRSAKSAIAKCHIFGRERVNCITLWFSPTQIPSAPGAYESGVAVLANNDKTVTIVSLNNTEPLDELSYPDCVNRALLSPDGGLLVAISDDPYLYVHQRVVPKGQTFDYGVNPGGRQGREWKLCTKLHLRGQRREDATDSRGSFAACFSNTGKYLAVGTQYGVISIFNTAAFATDEDPLMTCFTSSRPETEAGAVREMAFCPGPFDLLAWSEDRGHIGVADVRNNFISRQVLRIDEDDSFEHLSITEKSTIDPRLLDNRYDRGDAAPATTSTATTTSNLASTLDISSEATRRSNRSRDFLDRYQYPLTPDETQVLEALQEHRRRRELREQRQRTALPEYTSPWPSRPSVRSTLAHDSSRARERSNSVSRAVNDILGNIQSQRDRIREAHERLRSREDAERRRLNYLPPRRGAAFGRAAEPEGPGSRDTPPSRVMPAGWDSLDALNSILTENNGGTLSTFSQLPSDPASSATFLGQLVSHGLVRDLTDLEGDFIQMRLRSRRQPPQPDETAGLAWSDDGTILYVGAESGIYEFHINVMARRMYPSFTLR